MMGLAEAVTWALGVLETPPETRAEVVRDIAGDITMPQEHGFVDLVRYYLNEHNIEHPPLSFDDLRPYLPAE